MNRFLDEALSDMEKLDSVMFAIEKAYICCPQPMSAELAGRRDAAFFAVSDMVHRLASDLENLAEDQRVVDAIRAVKEIRRTCTLKTED